MSCYTYNDLDVMRHEVREKLVGALNWNISTRVTLDLPAWGDTHCYLVYSGIEVYPGHRTVQIRKARFDTDGNYIVEPSNDYVVYYTRDATAVNMVHFDVHPLPNGHVALCTTSYTERTGVTPARARNALVGVYSLGWSQVAQRLTWTEPFVPTLLPGTSKKGDMSWKVDPSGVYDIIRESGTEECGQIIAEMLGNIDSHFPTKRSHRVTPFKMLFGISLEGKVAGTGSSNLLTEGVTMPVGLFPPLLPSEVQIQCQEVQESEDTRMDDTPTQYVFTVSVDTAVKQCFLYDTSMFKLGDQSLSPVGVWLRLRRPLRAVLMDNFPPSLGRSKQVYVGNMQYDEVSEYRRLHCLSSETISDFAEDTECIQMVVEAKWFNVVVQYIQEARHVRRWDVVVIMDFMSMTNGSVEKDLSSIAQVNKTVHNVHIVDVTMAPVQRTSLTLQNHGGDEAILLVALHACSILDRSCGYVECLQPTALLRVVSFLCHFTGDSTRLPYLPVLFDAMLADGHVAKVMKVVDGFVSFRDRDLARFHNMNTASFTSVDAYYPVVAAGLVEKILLPMLNIIRQQFPYDVDAIILAVFVSKDGHNLPVLAEVFIAAKEPEMFLKLCKSLETWTSEMFITVSQVFLRVADAQSCPRVYLQEAISLLKTGALLTQVNPPDHKLHSLYADLLQGATERLKQIETSSKD